MEDQHKDAIPVLIAAFIIAAVGGMASLLRSNRVITWRAALTATLYSGMTGLVVALLWYDHFHGEGNVFFLLGVSGLAGIGGMTLADIILQAFKTGGLQFTIIAQPDPPSAPPTQNIPIPPQLQGPITPPVKDATNDQPH